MRVLITGIGDAFTSRWFGSSCVIEAPTGPVMIDCPDLIHRVLREARERSGMPLDPLAIDDIILTHLHGDHCNGLESFGFFRRVAVHQAGLGRERRPRLHTSQPVLDRLWDRLGPAMDCPFGDHPHSTLDDYYDVRLIEPEHASSIAGLTVECRFTQHAIPTIGLRISDGVATLGWSGDTAYVPEHIAWLAAADVIVHESNVGAVHTPIEKLNALDDELRSRMRLIHLPDDFDPSSTDIAIVHQGDVLTVTARAAVPEADVD